uniref:Glycosyltransferase n=1 Tax=Kalanchoe fedtschenkoi TaxID=63787 RepID=A0A7N0U1V6_KALFE
MERFIGNKAHILSFPFPAQGHINPNLQFCKRLVAKGLKVTLITTISIGNTISQIKPQVPGSDIDMEFISDGFDDPKKVEAQIAQDVDAYAELFKVGVKQSLIKFLQTTRGWECPPKVLIYDSNLPWVQDVVGQFGLLGAAFFTASCAVANIFHFANEGVVVKMPVEGQLSVPGLPLLETRDVPSFLHEVDAYPTILKLLLSQFDNLRRPKWVLFNSFDHLENEVVKSLQSQWPIATIGPTIPSMYLDKRLKTDKDYGLHLLKPDTSATTTAWLNGKKDGSVIYISFGSLANLSEEQAQEVAHALKNTHHPFIWVVREPELKKLPADFIENLSGKGLILSWCSQMEVLNHPAIGCFVTHCGWNSVLEALSAAVPLVAMPQWTDQPTNAKYVQDVWKVGIRVETNQSGKLTGREEIHRCISEVMDEGHKRSELRANAAKWKRLSVAAMDEGGSSDKNIIQFVTDVQCIL